MKKTDYIQARKQARKQRNMVVIVSFTVAMVFFSLLGLMMPIRPDESALENRKLKEFPKISFAGVMEGSYFSEISEWYSDSFPLRDVWMKQYDTVKGLYGIRTSQVIQGNAQKDDIPDVPVKPETSTSETEENIPETPAEQSTEAEPQSNAQAEQPKQDVPSETLPPITAQTQNGLFTTGDKAFGIYYFNRTSADIYIETVNRTAQNVAGQAKVYSLLVPLSASFYLDEASLKATDGSDEKAALDYYYGSLSDAVSKVQIYDTMMAHNAEYIYFRTDHHWNGRGAYYAYREWAKTKGVTPHELSEYTQHNFEGFLGSYYAYNKTAEMEANPDTVEAFEPLTHNRLTIHDMTGGVYDWPIVNDVTNYKTTQKYSTFAGADQPYCVISNPNVINGQVALIIKDSYANAMIPFLTDHFQTIHWIDYRYYNGNLTEFVKQNGVTDVIFLTGTEPITSVESMNRMSSLLP